MPDSDSLLPAPLPIDTRIYTVRGQSVMLDSDLAAVYEVTVSQLNQAVKRNERRFPPAFSFQLAQNEWDALRSQFVILETGRGRYRKYLPRVFTESGAVALAMVLNSDRAVAASLRVVDAFVRLRRVLDSHRELAHKVDELSAKVDEHGHAIAVIFAELEEMALSGIPEAPKERIGFKPRDEARSPKSRKKPQPH